MFDFGAVFEGVFASFTELLTGQIFGLFSNLLGNLFGGFGL